MPPHSWRLKFGALKEDEAQRLKLLEQENSRLERIVAEHALDIWMPCFLLNMAGHPLRARGSGKIYGWKSRGNRV